jgi:hypothetical protein
MTPRETHFTTIYQLQIVIILMINRAFFAHIDYLVTRSKILIFVNQDNKNSGVPGNWYQGTCTARQGHQEKNIPSSIETSESKHPKHSTTK